MMDFEYNRPGNPNPLYAAVNNDLLMLEMSNDGMNDNVSRDIL